MKSEPDNFSINDLETKASPPTPNDDVASEFYNFDDMKKIISSSDLSLHVIPRRNCRKQLMTNTNTI